LRLGFGVLSDSAATCLHLGFGVVWTLKKNMDLEVLGNLFPHAATLHLGFGVLSDSAATCHAATLHLGFGVVWALGEEVLLDEWVSYTSPGVDRTVFAYPG